MSNLGSSLGTALAGFDPRGGVGSRWTFAYALTALALISLIGLGIAFALPNQQRPARDATG